MLSSDPARNRFCMYRFCMYCACLFARSRAPCCPLLRIRAPGRAARPILPRALDDQDCDARPGRQDKPTQAIPTARVPFFFPPVAAISIVCDGRTHMRHARNRGSTYAVRWVPPHISRYIQYMADMTYQHQAYVARTMALSLLRIAAYDTSHLITSKFIRVRGPLRRPAATGSRGVLRSPTSAGSPARRRASRR
jgi:hypothetical protein